MDTFKISYYNSKSILKYGYSIKSQRMFIEAVFVTEAKTNKKQCQYITKESLGKLWTIHKVESKQLLPNK